MNDPNERVAESVARLRQRWGRGLPETAVLLGSGWGGLAASAGSRSSCSVCGIHLRVRSAASP